MPIRKSDYEDYDYREFWEDDKRYYEDQSERIALRSMLGGIDPKGKLFIDVGCGYARLFNEYSKFQKVMLIDYSMKNLRNARDRISRFLSDDPEKLSNVLFVSADAAALPLKNDSADVILTVRVVHHLEEPQGYFDEVKRVLKNGSPYLLEFANKRNLKNILRFFIGRMDTSPFGPTPSQVGETIRNYHPTDIYKKLSARGIRIEKVISVSNFRLNILKKVFGNNLLLFFEKIYQKLFSSITWGPSVFIKGYLIKNGSSSRDQKPKDSNRHPSKDITMTKIKDRKQFYKDLLGKNLLQFISILACPACSDNELVLSGNRIKCKTCKKYFPVDGNILDLKV